MSEVAATPAPTPAEAPPAPPPPEKPDVPGPEQGPPKTARPGNGRRLPDDIRAKLEHFVKTGEETPPEAPPPGKDEAKTEPKPAAKAKPKQAEQPKPPKQPAAEQPQPEQAVAKDPAADERKAQEQLKQARFQREHSEALAERERWKREHAKARAEADEHKAAVETFRKRLREAPLDVLAEEGLSYEALTRGIVDGKYRPRTASSVPDDVRRELDELKAWREEQASAKAEAAKAEERSSHIKQVEAYLAENADDWPFAASAPWAPAAIVDMVVRSGQNAMEALRGFEEQISTSVGSLLGNDRALSALLRSNPALKEAVASAIGTAVNPASSNGAGEPDTRARSPRSISSIPSGSTDAPPDKVKDPAGYRKWLHRKLEAFRDSGGATG